MTDCKHETAIILHTTPAYEIAMCTWGCGQHLVNVTDPDTRVTRSWTVAELVIKALAAETGLLELAALGVKMQWVSSER